MSDSPQDRCSRLTPETWATELPALLQEAAEGAAVPPDVLWFAYAMVLRAHLVRDREEAAARVLVFAAELIRERGRGLGLTVTYTGPDDVFARERLAHYRVRFDDGQEIGGDALASDIDTLASAIETAPLP